MASIPGNVASSLLNRLRELEERLVPFIRDVAQKAASESFDIAQDTAQGVLDDVVKGLESLKSTVQKNSSSPGG